MSDSDSGVSSRRTDNEAYYDEKIAPALAELARLCNNRGMEFISVVHNNGDLYRTILCSDANPGMRQVRYAALSNGNADHLIMALLQDGKRFGHNSAFLAGLEKPIE